MNAERVEVEVTRTKADYFWGILHNSLRAPRVLLILATIGLVGGAASSGYFVGEDLLTRAVFVAGGMVFLFALYALFLPVAIAISTGMSWKLPGAFAPIRFAFSPEGMKVSHETGSGETVWRVWRGFFETKSLFVVRHLTGVAQIVPKRGMSAETVAAIRSVLKRYLGNGGKGSS